MDTGAGWIEQCSQEALESFSSSPLRQAAVYEEAGEQEFADTKRIRTTAKKVKYLKVMNTMRQIGVVNSTDEELTKKNS